MENNGMLILGQYRVVRLLYKQENYAACQAVDIMDRQHQVCLLNIYEGPYTKQYATIYTKITHCDDFITLRMDGQSLIAVFRFKQYPSIDSVFYGDSGQPWQLRLEYADRLFKLFLAHWDQPLELLCASMMNRCLCVKANDNDFAINYMLIPSEVELNKREAICLLADQAEKVLLFNRNVPLEQRRFMRYLKAGIYKDAITLNSVWNKVKEEIVATYEDLYKRGLISREIKLLKISMKWKSEQKEKLYDR